jgi:hypothetical protein
MKYPVTLNQEYTLLHQEYQWNLGIPPDPYIVATAYILEGVLNVAALEAALNSTIERHASLRSAFIKNDNLPPSEREMKIGNVINDFSFLTGMYAQRLVSSAMMEIQMHFIEFLDPEEQEIEIENILRFSYKTPFNYSKPPFVRAHLFQLSHNRHLLVVMVHHLVCDIYSSIVFDRDWMAFYSAISSNGAPRLPVIKRHFLDFALEQYERATNGDYQKMLPFWEDQLVRFSMAGFNRGDFPYAYRGTISPASLGYEKISLDGDVIHSWEAFANKNKITLFMFYISACMIFLRKLSNHDAIMVSSHFANKTNLDYLNSVGWFANTWRLCAELPDKSTVTDVLSRVRASVLNAIANQSVPIQLLMKKSGLIPQTGDLFIVCDLIQMHQIENSQRVSNHLTIQSAPLPECLIGDFGEQLVLRLYNYKQGGMLFGIFPKNSFGEDGISHMLNELVSIMNWCVDNEHEMIADYKWLNERDSEN